MQNFQILGQWLSKMTKQYSAEKVHIRDPEELKIKLKKMFADGPQNLEIVTDFDQTITSFTSAATFSIFRQSEMAPKEFRQNMQNLYEYYVPIEKDQSLKVEEKHLHMQEWYDKVSEEFKKAQFSKQTIANILNSSNINLRYLFEPFFNECFTRKIPFHIVSGGVNTIINMILESVLPINSYDGLTIKTNQMVFTQDIMSQMNMVVTATTKANILENSGLKFPTNTILLGDLPSDFYMTKFLNLPNQVSIGFLDVIHLDQLEEYTKLFDITIVGDPSFLIPVMILTHTCADQPSEEVLELFNSKEYEQLRGLF